MSELKLKKVARFSSEDKIYKASNLLEPNKKWLKSKDDEQTKQFVVLELNESSQIRQINLENDSSAFIEILASNSSEFEDEETFESILPAASFMSPSESKSSTHTNRLKIFTDETSLDEKVASQKWRFIKIICTQPFNKDLQFGISSLKIFDKIAESDDERKKLAAKIRPGLFSIKKDFASAASTANDAPDSSLNKEETVDSNKASSIFQKWKNSEAGKKLHDEEEKEAEEKKKKQQKIVDNNGEESELGANNLSPNKLTSYSKKSPKKYNQILRGVIFALSGFQNPLRSEIRDRGLKLGAKYRPDWTEDCTHLICAFPNTPKAAVAKKSGGKIVTKEWIYDCEKKKELLNLEDYRLEEDDEDEDEVASKPRRAARNATKKMKDLYESTEEEDFVLDEDSEDRDFIVSDEDIEYEDEEEKRIESEEEEDFESEEETTSASDDKEEAEDSGRISKAKHKKSKLSSKKPSKRVRREKASKKTSKTSADGAESDASDLEEYKKQKEKEEIRKRLKEMKSKKTKEALHSAPPKNTQQEEKEDEENDWQLPTFFEDKNFFIYGDFDQKKSKTLSRTIIAYGGNVANYISDEVEFVITDKKWNKEFDESLNEHKNLRFVCPDWIEACNKRKKLVAYAPFEVQKND